MVTWYSDVSGGTQQPNPIENNRTSEVIFDNVISSEDDLLTECDVEEEEQTPEGATEVFETAFVGVFSYRFEPQPHLAEGEFPSADALPDPTDRSTEGYEVKNWYDKHETRIIVIIH